MKSTCLIAIAVALLSWFGVHAFAGTQDLSSANLVNAAIVTPLGVADCSMDCSMDCDPECCTDMDCPEDCVIDCTDVLDCEDGCDDCPLLGCMPEDCPLQIGMAKVRGMFSVTKKVQSETESIESPCLVGGAIQTLASKAGLDSSCCIESNE